MKSVCIIGSGPAGSILAVSLAQKDFDVLVLEAGNDIPDFDSDRTIDEIHTSGSTELKFGFSRQVGGASNLWSGRVAPFDIYDFEDKPWIPEGAWPFSRKVLEPYYRDAAEILGIPSERLFDSSWDLPDPFHKNGQLDAKKFMWVTPPFNAGTYLKEQSKLLPNLKVRTCCPVIRLERSVPNNVSSVEIVNETNQCEILAADIFVVSAGGVETPRLLLNSGFDNPNIGKYFSTHPKADMAVLELNKKVSVSHPLFSDFKKEDATCRYGLGLGATCQKEHSLPNHYVQLSPIAEYRASRLFEAIKGSSVMSSDLIDHSRFLRGLLPALGLYVYNLIGRLAGLSGSTRLFMLRGFLDQKPSAGNKITLSDEIDVYGMKKANISWTFSDEDRASVLKFFEIFAQEIESSGVGRVEFQKLRTNQNWKITAIHSHFMGTTRMGITSEHSVTDENAKVHDVDNLYVSGPSLFSTYGYANPVLTIMALSLKLSRHLIDKYSV